MAHGNYDYLNIKTNSNNDLLITLKLFDKAGKLLCWMSQNRWWVENNDVFDFQFSKNIFSVQSTSLESLLVIKIEKNIVRVTCKMYVNGRFILFNDEKINISNSIIGAIEKIVGNKTSIAISV